MKTQIKCPKCYCINEIDYAREDLKVSFTHYLNCTQCNVEIQSLVRLDNKQVEVVYMSCEDDNGIGTR